MADVLSTDASLETNSTEVLTAHKQLESDLRKQAFLLEPANFAALCKIRGNRGVSIVGEAVWDGFLTPGNSTELFTDETNFSALCNNYHGRWAIFAAVRNNILTPGNSTKLFADNLSALHEDLGNEDSSVTLIREVVSKGILTEIEVGEFKKKI